MLAAPVHAQQTPATGTPAATTPAAPAATTPKAATTAKTPVKKTGTAAKTAAAPAALTTRKDKVSYALGMNIGSNLGSTLKKDSVEVDWNLVSQGLKDSTGGGKTRLTEEEAKAVLTEVQNEIQKQQQEKMKEASEKNKTEGEAFLAANKSKEGVVTLPSGLQYKILTAGTGPKPTATDSVACNYRGTLIDGTEFDSSYKRGQPVTFPVSGVIKGWTEALQLMPVGSKWQLFIPSGLAYAERGAGAQIGPNATLIFEVELLSIVDKNADKNKDDSKGSQTGGTSNAPSESSQKKTYTMNSNSVTAGPNGEIRPAVDGQMLLEDKGLVLTGGKVGEIGSNSIQIAGRTFQVVEATKICGADGKRAKLNSFKVGDKATVTSALDEKDALTLRSGLAFIQWVAENKTSKPQNYECE